MSSSAKWIRCADRLPVNGQEIAGRNRSGQVWTESFDPHEPLGLMVEWMPAGDYVPTQKELPAFPISTIDGFTQHGMTLRQWYAGQALAGIMANPERWKQIAADYESGKKTYDECSAANATKAVSLADALLAALAEREG
jgi:hypothetical protein